MCLDCGFGDSSSVPPVLALYHKAQVGRWWYGQQPPVPIWTLWPYFCFDLWVLILWWSRPALLHTTPAPGLWTSHDLTRKKKQRDIELRTQTKHDFNHGIATVIYHPVIVSFIELSKGSAFVNYHLKQSEVDLTEPLIWASYIQSVDGIHTRGMRRQLSFESDCVWYMVIVGESEKAYTERIVDFEKPVL